MKKFCDRMNDPRTDPGALYHVVKSMLLSESGRAYLVTLLKVAEVMDTRAALDHTYQTATAHIVSSELGLSSAPFWMSS